MRAIQLTDSVLTIRNRDWPFHINPKRMGHRNQREDYSGH